MPGPGISRNSNSIMSQTVIVILSGYLLELRCVAGLHQQLEHCDPSPVVVFSRRLQYYLKPILFGLKHTSRPARLDEDPLPLMD